MKLINCDELDVDYTRGYGGATGSKIAVKYDNAIWMLKRGQSFKTRTMKNVSLSYANDPISEYIGSHIYGLLNIPVHDTLLGSYSGRICVLCKDLAYPYQIVELRTIRNMIMDENVVQSSSGMSLYLRDVLETVNMSNAIDTESSLERFWLMFVIDALIGNTDRNNGNWGFLKQGNSLVLSPVYDCGGCLNNKRSDDQMLHDIETDNINNLAINYVFNFLDERGKRINPFHYIEKHPNKHIVKALELIDSSLLSKMYVLIDSLGDLISETRNRWYKEILLVRLNKLIELKDGIVADEGLPKKMNF